MTTHATTDACATVPATGALARGDGADVPAGALTRDTQANTAKATVTAARNVSASAESSALLTDVAAAVADAGAPVIGLTTRTFLGLEPDNPLSVRGLTNLTAGGNVLAAATDVTDITQFLGTAGNVKDCGAASVGAAAAVPVVSETTEAVIGPGARRPRPGPERRADRRRRRVHPRLRRPRRRGTQPLVGSACEIEVAAFILFSPDNPKEIKSVSDQRLAAATRIPLSRLVDEAGFSVGPAERRGVWLLSRHVTARLGAAAAASFPGLAGEP